MHIYVYVDGSSVMKVMLEENRDSNIEVDVDEIKCTHSLKKVRILWNFQGLLWFLWKESVCVELKNISSEKRM